MQNTDTIVDGEIRYGDEFEHEENGKVYVVEFSTRSNTYNLEEGITDPSTVFVKLARRWDSYGPVPTFWNEQIDEFLENVNLETEGDTDDE